MDRPIPMDSHNCVARVDAILREINYPRLEGYGADYFSNAIRSLLLEVLVAQDPQTWEDLRGLVIGKLQDSKGLSNGCMDLIAAIGPSRRGQLPG